MEVTKRQSDGVKGEESVGAIAGICSGTIENCHVLDGDLEIVEADESDESTTVYPGSSSSSPMGLGGIAGMLSGGSIAGCTVFRSNIYPLVEDAECIGGIVGVVSSGMDYDTYTQMPATLKDCLFTSNISKQPNHQYVGAIAGMSQDMTIITGNYYIDGINPHTIPNSTLLGINGADVAGAHLAIVSEELPSNIGEAGTQYAYNGVLPYTHGLYYNLNYYLSSTTSAGMEITLSDDDDNSELLSTYSGQTVTVTLADRTFYKDGSWNTICLPFTIDDIADSPLCNGNETVELWQISTTEDSGFDEESGTLILNFENCIDDDGVSTLIAGRPYLIRWTDTSGTLENPVFTEVTISATSPEDDNTFGMNDEITFIGTFAQQTFETEDRSILFLGAENTLYYPLAETSIGAQRAYFQLNGITAGDPIDPQSGNIRAFVLNFGDETTSIDHLPLTIDHEADAWYDMSGRKFNGKPSSAGIYINNGRKVLIK